HVEEALRRGAAVQHRQAARARGIENGGVAILGAHALQLPGNGIEGFLPSDALELAAPARAFAPERILEAVRRVDALDLAYSARAGMQRRQLRLPSARVGRDLDNAAIANVCIDDAAPAAVVAAGTGEDGLTGARGGARPLIDGRPLHAGLLVKSK